MATFPPGGYNAGESAILVSDQYTAISGVSSYSFELGVSTERTSGHVAQATPVAGGNTLLYFKLADMTLWSVGESIMVGNLPGAVQTFRIVNIHAHYIIEVIGTLTPPSGWSSGQPIYYYEPIVPNHGDAAGAPLAVYQWALSADGTSASTAYAPMDQLTSTSIPGTSQWYILIKLGTSASFSPGKVKQYYHFKTNITTIPYVAPTDDCVGLDCADPFVSSGTGAVIEVDCSANPTNVFNPYAQNKSVNLYKQLNNIVSDLFGHQVNYFRTEADPRTKDVTLMEYSLHNVADNKNVKILVPDNEFPSEANTFDIFGMEFAEFEVHIVHEKFKDVFGTGLRPRAKDYMFIPIINKMYEVSSVSIADEFNASKSYWRVMLTKYQDRSSVIKGSYDTATDNLITGIDEVFGEEISDEQTKVTKPVQYQSVSKILEDGHRIYKDGNLTIKDESIINNFMTISNNYYDLSKITLNTTALRYNRNAVMVANGQLGITAWIRPTFEITDTSPQKIISLGTLCSISISTTRLVVNINGVAHKWLHNTSMSKDKWYGIVVNIKNNTNTIDMALYSISVASGAPAITSLVLEGRTSNLAINSAAIDTLWSETLGYELFGSKLNVTNVRVFDKEITAAEEIAILNQNIVRDNDHAIIIDNAIPSLGYQKFKNAR